MMTAEKIDALAALVLAQQKERLASKYSQWQADAEEVRVTPGAKYTKIDLGSFGSFRGSLMVEQDTGNIYGIKGYGKVHKGHFYGTLDTTDQWYWGEYYPQARESEESTA